YVLPGEELTVKLRYDAAFVSAPSVRRLASLVEQVVDELRRRGDGPVRAIGRPVLSGRERPRPQATSAVQGIVQRFQRQAAATPERVAVTAGGRHVTYDELNARTDALAARLRRHGAAPETFVGLAMDRGIDFVCALLAVLKAGAAFVPLDLRQPRERLAF